MRGQRDAPMKGKLSGEVGRRPIHSDSALKRKSGNKPRKPRRKRASGPFRIAASAPANSIKPASRKKPVIGVATNLPEETIIGKGGRNDGDKKSM